MKTNQKGQMLVLLLLIMVVGLTIGLFLMGRTTTDISLTTNITESTRAFNAAEAGIEEAMRTASIVTGSPVPFATGVAYTLQTSALGNSASIYPSIKTIPTKVGQVFTVWFVPHSATGDLVIPSPPAKSFLGNTFDICYTNSLTTPAVIPAIKVTLIYRDGLGSGNIRSDYTGYDSQARANGFSAALPAGGPCPGYDHRANINLLNTFGSDLTLNSALIAIRIMPVYADSFIALNPAPGTIPPQGTDITSSGSVGETTRKINVKQPYLIPAPFMDHALYSTGQTSDIAK